MFKDSWSQIVIQVSKDEVIKVDMPSKFLADQIKELRLQSFLTDHDAVMHPPIVFKSFSKISEKIANCYSLGFHYDDSEVKNHSSAYPVTVTEQVIDPNVVNLQLRPASNIFSFKDEFL